MNMGRPKGSPNKAAVGGKRKADKDPNKPKRAMSGYFYYMAAMREEYAKIGKASNKVAEFTKEISVKWRALTPPEKKIYDAKAAVDKARYEREMAAYSGGSKTVKDPNKPKRPMSAYFCFLGEFRKKMVGKGVDHKDMLRMAGQEWNKLDAVAKRPYQALADIEKQKYEKAISNYTAGGSAPKRPKVAEVAKNGAEEEDDEEEDDEEDDEEEEEEDDE